MPFSGKWEKESKVKEVSIQNDETGHRVGASILLEDHIGFFIDEKYLNDDSLPKPGDTVELNTRVFQVCGIAINGKVLYLKSDKELEEDHANMVEKMKADKKAKYEVEKEDLAKRIEAMPEPFRRRFVRFTRNNPNFMVEHGSYEVFCCEQAVAFADTLKTVGVVTDFEKMSYEDQRKAVPAMSDGHSGNTFSFAVALARTYIVEPRAIPFFHAASAIIVGCEEAGCHPLTDEEKKEIESWEKAKS